jgi:hypothetical protein
MPRATTWWPKSARQVPDTSPTYPVPIIAIRITCPFPSRKLPSYSCQSTANPSCQQQLWRMVNMHRGRDRDDQMPLREIFSTLNAIDASSRRHKLRQSHAGSGSCRVRPREAAKSAIRYDLVSSGAITRRLSACRKPTPSPLDAFDRFGATHPTNVALGLPSTMSGSANESLASCCKNRKIF